MRDIFTFHSAICLLGGKEADSEECAEADEMHFNEVNFKQHFQVKKWGEKKCNFVFPLLEKVDPSEAAFRNSKHTDTIHFVHHCGRRVKPVG